MTRRVFLAVALTLTVLFVGGLTTQGRAEDQRGLFTTLKVLVFDRTPYYQPGLKGGYAGVVATPATRAFEKAGIPIEWIDMQPNGHLRTIEANQEPICALGWFKKPDREAFGQYSDSIYQDKPSRIMTRVDNRAVQAHKTARSLLADKSLRLGDKLGYAYGPYLDGLLAELEPPRATVAQDETGMARMMLGGRFDYMIVSEVEAVSLLDEFGAAAHDFVLLSMADIPPGNDRYLLCSKVTDPDLIKRFNAALGELK
jgi:polar amino acid transport system substrate-binding protein